MIDVIQDGASATKRGNGSTGQFRQWKYRRAIEISPTLVDALLTNEVFLIDTSIGDLLPNFWTTVLNGGGDLRFSSDAEGNNRLSLEVVQCDTSAEELECYIKVTSISSTLPTWVYIFYGMPGETQPAAGAAFGSEDVWSNNYEFCFHGDDDDDSAGNITTQDYNGSFAAGKVGQAFDLDGVNDRLALDSLGALSAYTVEAWINIDNIVGNKGIVTQQNLSTNGRMFTEIDEDELKAIINNNTPGSQFSSFTVSASTWQHISFTYDQSQVIFRLNYDDGVDPDNYTSAFGIPGSIDYTIGAIENSGGGTWIQFFAGLLDEVRYSGAVRSNADLKFSYNNQNSVLSVCSVLPYVPS